jgi:DNA repair protein RecO (recombination protein O)
VEPTTTTSHGRGFVLARRERGESDLSLDVLLDDGRVLRAVARGGARSSRRFSAGLAPFTRYRFVFGRSLAHAATLRLDEASVDQPYPGILADLRRTAAAGAASVVARELGGEVTLDAALYELYDALIAALDSTDAAGAGAGLLRFVHAAFEHAGHPMVLDACVRCGRAAPDNALVRLSPVAGGVVCAACGGGPIALPARDRRALRAVLAGSSEAFERAMLAPLARMIEPHAHRGAAAITGAMPHWAV